MVWISWPVYSCVSWSSSIWFVYRIAPNRGCTGSRIWKSIGPYLVWRMTLSSNLPSSGANTRYWYSAQSLKSSWTKLRQTICPLCGATVRASMFAPSAWVRP